jgi:hypothetical protein
VLLLSRSAKVATAIQESPQPEEVRPKSVRLVALSIR